MIDATHPFAARISHNAARACAEAGVPLLALRRPPWAPEPDDRWIEVSAIPDAVDALGKRPRRVFLTIGRTELASFEAAPQHCYLVRTIEPVGEAFSVPNMAALQDRGPFDVERERDLMRSEAIEVARDEEFRWASDLSEDRRRARSRSSGRDGRSAGDAGRRPERADPGGGSHLARRPCRTSSWTCPHRARRIDEGRLAVCPLHPAGRARPDDQDGRHVGAISLDLA